MRLVTVSSFILRHSQMLLFLELQNSLSLSALRGWERHQISLMNTVVVSPPVHVSGYHKGRQQKG